MLRDIISTELYTILLVLCLILVATTKLLFPKRFQDFIAILFDHRYLKIYAREQKFIILFEGLLFTNLVIGLAIFTLICYKLNVNLPKTEYYLLFIFGLVICAILLIKTILERIISNILGIDSLINSYVFQKISYKNFAGLLLIPINALLIYTVSLNKLIVFIFILILLIIYVSGILLFIKNNFKALKHSLLYFILYLCALEIMPYLFLYKLFTTE